MSEVLKKFGPFKASTSWVGTVRGGPRTGSFANGISESFLDDGGASITGGGFRLDVSTAVVGEGGSNVGTWEAEVVVGRGCSNVGASPSGVVVDGCSARTGVGGGCSGDGGPISLFLNRIVKSKNQP